MQNVPIPEFDWFIFDCSLVNTFHQKSTWSLASALSKPDHFSLIRASTQLTTRGKCEISPFHARAHTSIRIQFSTQKCSAGLKCTAMSSSLSTLARTTGNEVKIVGTDTYSVILLTAFKLSRCKMRERISRKVFSFSAIHLIKVLITFLVRCNRVQCLQYCNSKKFKNRVKKI